MLKISKLYKIYGKHSAISDMSIDIDFNGLVCVVGNNGAGKTTLFNLIMGYNKPTRGQVEVLGHKPVDNGNVASSIIIMDEKTSYFGSGKLDKIIAMHKGFITNFDYEKCCEILTKFKMPAGKSCSKLSKGMKNQFNIAIALASNKPIILMDEPTSGLDETARYTFKKIIKQELINKDKLILLSTHLLGELEEIADKLLVIMDNGEYRLDDTKIFKEMFIKLSGNIKDIQELSDKHQVYDFVADDDLASCIVKSSFAKEFERQDINIAKVSATEACRIICSNGGLEHDNY